MFKSFLFLVFLSLVSGHWICKLEGGESCVTSPGDEIITEGFEGAWISHKTQVTVSNEINCAFACDRLNCALYIYPEEFKCILLLPKKLIPPANAGSALHFRQRKLTNVALLKPTYGSSAHVNPIQKKENAVDGITDDAALIFSVHISDLNGWLLVDLESEYVIRAVRIFSRLSNVGKLFSTIYAGNSLILDGDFSSYTPLFIIETSRQTVNSHYVVSLVNTKSYRYVAVKRDIVDYVLQLIELEVYA